MAASRDQRSGKSRHKPSGDAKARTQPTEHAKREIRKLDRDQGVSAEMAAQLQAQWGNQAVAQLLELPASGELAATAAERRELGEDEEELLDRLGDDVDGPRMDAGQGGALALGALRGLPATGAVAGAGRASELQHGGDDDDDDDDQLFDLPDDLGGTALRFDRSGRGNLAKLQEHRAQGCLPPATISAARSELQRGSQEIAGRKATAGQPVGDALFRAPLEAWEDASLVAGRGCGMDERQDLAGPYDPLGRPMAVGAFCQARATTPIGRSLARLCASPPGALMPESGGLAGAAARIGSLAVLGMAAEGFHQGSLRDRALRTALASAALELTLVSAGDVAESVPPAHTLYARITGQRPAGGAPDRAPGHVARHWVVPALRAVGQAAPLPVVRRWSPPPPSPTLDPDDPMSVVDFALRSDTPGQAERIAELGPLLGSIEALLAAGGRAQVELCSAALASRRPAFDGVIATALRRAYRAFRGVALELLEARAVLAQAHQQPVALHLDDILSTNSQIDLLRDRMDAARERCLAELAVICELG